MIMHKQTITLAAGKIDDIAQQWLTEAEALGGKIHTAAEGTNVTLITLPRGSEVEAGEYRDYYYVALPGERVLAYSLDPNAQESLLEAKYETYLNVWFSQAQQAEQLDWLMQELPSATITDQTDESKMLDVSIWELHKAGRDVDQIYTLLERRGLDYSIGERKPQLTAMA